MVESAKVEGKRGAMEEGERGEEEPPPREELVESVMNRRVSQLSTMTKLTQGFFSFSFFFLFFLSLFSFSFFFLFFFLFLFLSLFLSLSLSLSFSSPPLFSSLPQFLFKRITRHPCRNGQTKAPSWLRNRL